MWLLIKGGRVLDPAQGRDFLADVLINRAQGRIVAVGPGVRNELGAESPVETLDATGLCVAPGFIDLHTHLREPGREDEETIESGVQAAVAGGFTAVTAMPNTQPPADSAAVVEFVRRRGDELGLARVYPVGCISKGREGRELAPLGELAEAGARAFSDDGSPVMNARLMRLAMEYSLAVGLPLLLHEEDTNLTAEGVVNEGRSATLAGLKGMPAVAEEVLVARDLLLAAKTGARVHFCHLSSARSVEMVRQARGRGLAVTAEATPHHITLTDEAIRTYDARVKVNPPLRTGQDAEALVAGLADGTIGAIATDHAPHTQEEKEREFDVAPFGMVGLETAFAVAYTRLVRGGSGKSADGTGVDGRGAGGKRGEGAEGAGSGETPRLTLLQLVDRLSTGPARILGVPGGRLAAGDPADITLFDPEATVRVDAARFRSRSRNTPFDGWELRGQIVATLVGGRVVYRTERP
ncbi:MAG: dihydroorotase [Firmicutes bacterium]|nr:dihydroorotase [Bacillota bacterium]